MNDDNYLMARIRARCHEDGDCLIWEGAANNRGPIFTVDKKEQSVRRAAWEAKHGVEFPKGKLARRCTESVMCVNPSHIVPVTRAQITKHVMDAKPAMVKYAERVKGHRARGLKFGDDAVRDIRTSGDHWSVLMERHGCSRTYVFMLRRGQYRKDQSNPFAGLGSRG